MISFIELKNAIWQCYNSCNYRELFKWYRYCVKNKLAPNNLIDKTLFNDSVESEFWNHSLSYTKEENLKLYDINLLTALLKGLLQYKRNKKGGR